MEDEIAGEAHIAKFPVHRDLAGFDFDRSKVDHSLITELGGFAFTEAAQTSQNGTATLGHTTGNFQAYCQEEETTSGYPTTEAAQRPEEDGDES